MRFRHYCTILVILISASSALAAEFQPVSGAISATATVIHPVGLIEARDRAESFAMPILTEYSSRWFLYVPRGNALILLNGTPIEVDSDRSDDLLSALDVTPLVHAKSGSSPVVVTVIYSGN